MSESQVLHFFGGKGGAGRSTLSAAFALNLSETTPKDKILLASLDPAGSLGDLVKKKLTSKPTKLVAGKGNGGLFAAELDPTELSKALLKEVRPALLGVAQKGALLGEDELKGLLEQALAGLEDIAPLVYVASLLEDGSFDKAVVDGASASVCLKLFDVPVALRKVLAHANRAPSKSEKGKKDGARAELEEQITRLERLLALLKDPQRHAFHLITLAEPVSETQTRLLFTGLKDRGVTVAEIVVNQVEDGEGGPEFQGRRGLQAPHVRKFQQLDKAVPVELLGKREVAPRGIDALKKFAKEWASGKETKALEFAAAEGPPALVRAPSMPPIAAPPLPPTRLIFFIGQGGVGKSSCAAAAAVTLTEKEGPVLLISADPAHSLSDVLQSRLTDTETQVKGTKGLYARELDAQAWLNGLRRRIKEKAERIFGPDVKGQEIPLDRELLRNLLEWAPSGIEDLAALAALSEALLQERFKRIVVDIPPATHSVRLLELPALAKGWLGALHAVLGKYRNKGAGELADEIGNLLRYVKRFEDALATPSESRFVAVTRADELAALRTERLVEYLKGKSLSVERVLVNRVLPKSSSPRWENRRKNELLATKAIEKRMGLPVTVAPALGRYPAGLRELKAFRTAWYALSATPAKIKAA